MRLHQSIIVCWTDHATLPPAASFHMDDRDDQKRVYIPCLSRLNNGTGVKDYCTCYFPRSKGHDGGGYYAGHHDLGPLYYIRAHY